MHSDRVTDHRPHQESLVRLNIVLVLALLVLCFIALAAFAWTRPSKAALPVTYRQTGRMTYSAQTPTTSIYGSAGVVTGDPVYSKIVPALHITYAYRFATTQRGAMHGTEQLMATVSVSSGLARSIPLQPPTHFEGVGFKAATTLQLSTIDAVVSSFSAVLGSTATYIVSITPHVIVRATLGHALVTTSFDKGARFTFTEGSSFSSSSSVFKPAGNAPDTTYTGNPTHPLVATGQPLVASSASTVPTDSFRDAVLLFGLSVDEVRIGALILLAVALGGLVLLGRPLFVDGAALDGRTRMGGRFGSGLVDIGRLPDSARLTVVDLTSYAGLVQVSRRLECPLLHVRDQDADHYAIVDNGTLYRFASGREARHRARGEAGASAGRHLEGASGSASPGERATELLFPVAGNGRHASMRTCPTQEHGIPGLRVQEGTSTPLSQLGPGWTRAVSVGPGGVQPVRTAKATASSCLPTPSFERIE